MTAPRIIPVQSPILGSDGLPLVSVATDRSDLNARQVITQTVPQLLLAAGRMLRDGKSLGQIRVELHADATLGVTDRVLENFARKGLAYLEAEIAAGREPAESISTEMREQWDVKDEAMVDSTGLNDVTPEYLRGE